MIYPLSKTQNKIYRELIGTVAEADGGKTEARAGDIKSFIGAVADVLFVEEGLNDTKPTLDMLIALGKLRAKKRKKS